MTSPLPPRPSGSSSGTPNAGGQPKNDFSVLLTFPPPQTRPLTFHLAHTRYNEPLTTYTPHLFTNMSSLARSKPMVRPMVLDVPIMLIYRPRSLSPSGAAPPQARICSSLVSRQRRRRSLPRYTVRLFFHIELFDIPTVHVKRRKRRVRV